MKDTTNMDLISASEAEYMSKRGNNSRFGLRIDPKLKIILSRLSELKGISSSGLIRMLIINERIDTREELKKRGCYNGELEV